MTQLILKSLAVFLNKQPNLGKGLTRGVLPRLKLETIAVDLFTIIFKADKLPQLVHRPPIFSFEIVEDVFENKTAGDLLTASSKGGEKRRPRLRVVLHFPFRDSRATETRARVKITPREKGAVALLTIPEGK